MFPIVAGSYADLSKPGAPISRLVTEKAVWCTYTQLISAKMGCETLLRQRDIGLSAWSLDFTPS
jgi:hypothetical protein